MDTNEIQKRIDAIATAMVAKALPQPDACFSLRSHSPPHVYIRWETPRYSDGLHGFQADTIEAALDKADAFVADLPSPEEAKRAAFIAALSDAIEKGKAADIEVDTVNLLMAEMKRISKNALQHKPEGVA